MRSALLWTLLLLPLAISPALGQGGRQERSSNDDPVEVLLEIRRELGLTRAQVASLREIQGNLERLNRPLVQELLAIQQRVRASFVGLSADSGGRGRPTQAQLDAARAPLQKIQENNLAAMEQVNALLTSHQKRRAATLLQIRDRIDRRPGWMRWPRDRDRDRDRD